MKTFNLRLLFFFVCAFLMLNANAATYYQSAPSYNSAFQSLVNSAVDGDVIILQSGSHFVTTPIVIPVGKNGITIRGENGAVVRKTTNAWNSSAFEISGNYNRIDNIELDGGNLPEAGIIIYGQHNTIENSSIHNCGNASAVGAGILLHNSGNPVCAFNTVIGCKVYYNYMVGISQNGHSDGVIRDNQMYENGAEGLTIDIGSHNNYIYNNWIHKNNIHYRGVGGVGIDCSNGNVIDNNTIDFNENRSGLTFQNNICGCDGTIVTNNRLNFNTQYGIHERSVNYVNTNSLFQNNEMVGNGLGTHFVELSSNFKSSAISKSDFNEETSLDFSIYPIPAADYLTIKTNDSENLLLEVFNSNGVKVVQAKGMPEGMTLDVSDLSNGIYYIKISSNDFSQTQKVLIER